MMLASSKEAAGAEEVTSQDSNVVKRKPVQLLTAAQRRQTYESVRKLEEMLPRLVKEQVRACV